MPRHQKSEVSPNKLSYNGPIKTKADRDNNDLVTLVLIWDQALTAAGTAINSTWSFNNPSNCIDWSDYAASYDQYRVLGLQLEYCPNSTFTNPTTNTYAPIYSVIDRDTATALASYAAAANYASLATHTLDKRWSVSMRMESSAEAQFFNTQSVPGSSGGIKTFASGLSNVTFGRATAFYRVQFRGRGI